MRNIGKYAMLATIAGILTVPVATPSFAHWSRHHYRHHVRVYHGYGAYAYAPRRHYWNAGDRNERDCMRSPASLRYRPCLNWE